MLRDGVSVDAETLMSGRMLMLVQAQPPLTGRVGERLEARGYQLEIRNPIDGDPLPRTLDGFAGVVVFGGPMSVNDSELSGLGEQIRWIPRAVASGVPFLGICLGAQLLARGFGARVAPHPDGVAEIGYFPIRPTSGSGTLFDGLDSVYQWHLEGFELPSGAELLAGGETFPNQAFRIGARAYGIQFHPEVDADIMEDWMSRAAHRLELPGAQQPDQQRRGNRDHDPAVAAWLDRFLDGWLT